MLNRSLSAIALSFVAVVGFGCSSGGGESSTSSFGSCSPGGGGVFCLTSCSLGCSVGGCSVTDIAPNQPISLTFSQLVDAATVNFSTISIKTASGRTPEGRFEVRDNVVEFRPQIRVTGGTTAFGFLANETYVLNLPDASESGQVLKAVSGQSLSQPLVCSLRVSQNIVDLDQSPPKATMITPTQTTNVDKNTVIILEFSEIIDIAPFQGATTQTSPIQYLIRKTMQKPNGLPTERVCDQNFLPLTLEGLPQAENDAARGITRVTLAPTVPLPSQICVEVVVTEAVHDLSGTPAVPHSFRFTTDILLSGEGEIVERFAGDSQLDKSVSSGIWRGGKGLPPQIGGTGVLGTFDISAGKSDPTDPKRYFWDTDSMTIAGVFTPTGNPIQVDNGVFEFTDFHLREGFTMVFTGSNPVHIRVRGRALIEGTIQANAPTAPFFAAVPTPGSPKPIGQLGSMGNCGGARGGQGGDSCLNTGSDPKYDGRPGETLVLPSGNGYATQAAGAAGKGSPQFPANGINTVYCALSGVFCGVTGAGGGGGGFIMPGTDPFNLVVNGVPANPCKNLASSGSAPGIGGAVFNLGSLLNTNTGPNKSLNFYSVGGSGGGGGGSHPLLSRKRPFDKWAPGSAGAGGGGIVIFRVGGDFSMKTTAAIQVKGGDGYVINGLPQAGEPPGDNLFNMPTPGGGGSGGSILLQVYGSTEMLGVLDCSGGKGGILDNSPTNQLALTSKGQAGDGGAGYYRLEKPNTPSIIEVGQGVPVASAGNVGKLEDSEFKGVSQSNFYATKLTFPPTFLRYILECNINGNRMVFSDDDQVGNPTAKQYDADYAGLAGAGNPVQLEIQGAEVSTVTGLPDLVTLGPWRERVQSKTVQSLNDDNATGVRFRLTYDTANGATTIEVLRISVFFVE